MRSFKWFAIAAFLSLFGTGLSYRQEPSEDVWRPLRGLVGEWRGTGSGFGHTSDVTHHWKFVLDGRFLELRTKSVTRGDEKTREVHEDVGFLSHDTDRGAFVFRQFLSEGYVNTFEVSVSGRKQPTLVFQHRETESSGGMRAQMRLTFAADDEYEMTLDLASPGKDFVPCQTMRMGRWE